MNEALEKVRSAFGDEGMIVGTRRFRRGGWLGVGGREMVEVFVADTRSRIENVRREGLSRGHPEPGGSLPAGERQGTAIEFERLSSGLTKLRQDIRTLLDRKPEAGGFEQPFLRECFELLLSREVDPRVADGVVREVGQLRVPAGFPSSARVQSVLRSQLSRLFVPNPVADTEARPRVVWLVGPTGVGKTTTIAKLAARAKLNEGRSVGLITLDTFRIAAVDQLQKYAEIIGVPLRVVRNAEELDRELTDSAAAGLELVFLDSAGRSHRDEPKMAELKEFLEATPDAEVHLVLSCTTHTRTLENIAERFADIEFDRVILTKVDETVSMGALVGFLLRLGKPVSYVTDGQNVPDDIMACDPERLADLVLKSQTA